MDIENKLNRCHSVRRILCEREAKHLAASKSFGIDPKYVEVVQYGKQTFAERESDGQEGDFYYYGGPSPERGFCKYMLKLDKVFSSGEVQQLGELLGYMSADGLEYVPGEIMPKGGPGGPNCKHYWIKFKGKIVLTPAPTERQITTIVSKSVFE